MPLYHFLHAIPLSESQKDSLAQAITKIHSETFTTPKNFVQCDFQDVSNASTYIGGQRYKGNHIHANVRTGPSRSQAEWDNLCREVSAAWDRIVGCDSDKGPAEGVVGGEVNGGAAVPDRRLRSVIVLGGMTAGVEAGFVLPPAGGDVAWMKQNWEAFTKRADAGDSEMREMVEEIKERGLLDGEQGILKKAAKSMEEALGWGDSA